MKTSRNLIKAGNKLTESLGGLVFGSILAVGLSALKGVGGNILDGGRHFSSTC